MTVATRQPFFFVHVMKTAGMTFNRHIDANFAPDEIYPGPDDETGVDYWVIQRLRDAVEQRRESVRLWRGHFPFFVTDLVPEALTLSLVREPVARTLSLIAQRQQLVHPDKRLEEIYDDPVIFGRELHDHQTKVFSLTDDDGAATWVHVLELDEGRLAAAKKRLDTVDLLGCQERFDAFLATLATRWGWAIDDVEPTNVGTTEPVVPESFRRRIADDNALDMELYEYARGICA